MSEPRYLSKIVTVEHAVTVRTRLRAAGKIVVFTNGCFDILHPGHVDYLHFARTQGDALVVGLNTDASVRLNKGPDRPFVPEADRARVLAALEMVDYVVLFDTLEPVPLIEQLLPDILVKGADWAHFVSGSEVVKAHGGRIVLAPLLEGFSTTDLADKIRIAGARKDGDTSCSTS